MAHKIQKRDQRTFPTFTALAVQVGEELGLDAAAGELVTTLVLRSYYCSQCFHEYATHEEPTGEKTQGGIPVMRRWPVCPRCRYKPAGQGWIG